MKEHGVGHGVLLQDCCGGLLLVLVLEILYLELLHLLLRQGLHAGACTHRLRLRGRELGCPRLSLGLGLSEHRHLRLLRGLHGDRNRHRRLRR
jgi:hypothetical protein